MSARKARVSLCMIVRDEERNLGECLTPVAHLFDEIVIVDTGSRDKTRAIAQQFTPNVFDFSWCDDFSAARNECLRHATGDWIFWLDADDRVRPPQVGRLKELLDGLDGQPQVYLMDTRLLPGSENEESCFVTHQRLFLRHPDVRWKGRVHEQLAPELATLGYESVFSDVEIEHTGYQVQTVAERKHRRKLRLLRMDFAVDPDDASTLLHLGMALRQMPNPAEARVYLLRLVEMGLGSAACMRWVYDALAYISLNEGKPLDGVRWAERGLEVFPGDENMLLELAIAYYGIENYDAATATLRLIMDAPPTRHMRFGALGNVKDKAAPRMLGVVQRMQRDFHAAEATLRGVLDRFPDDVSGWYNLGLVYLDAGNGLALAPVVQELLKLPEGTSSAGLLAALWHMRYGDLTLAGPLIDNLIAQSPQLPRPRMLRAEWLSKMQAPIEAQIQALRDVLRVQPGNMEARHWIKEAERFKSAAAAAAATPWSTSVVTMPGAAVG